MGLEDGFEEWCAEKRGPLSFAHRRHDGAALAQAPAWEGVPMYLSRAAVKATLGAVWQLCGSGSAIAFDMWHLVDDPGFAGTARRAAPTALSLIGEPVTFGIHPEEIDHFLGRRGFTVTDLALATELQERYAPDNRAAVDDSLYVVLATRLESLRAPDA